MAKKYLKKKGNRKMKMKRTKGKINSFCGSIDNRKIEISIPIYAFVNTLIGLNGYTFNPAPTQTALLSNIQLLDPTGGNTLTADSEFTRAANLYAMVRIKGVSLCFRRTLNISAAAGNWLNLPPVFCDLTNYIANYNIFQTAFDSDTRYAIQVLNTDSKPISKYYKIPPILSNVSSYTWGSNVWNSTDSLITASSYSMYLILDTENDVTSSVSGGTEVQEIGQIQITAYMQFTKKLLKTP